MEKVFVPRFNRDSDDPKPGVYSGNKKRFLRYLPKTLFWETDIVLYEGKRRVVAEIEWESPRRYTISDGIGGASTFTQSVLRKDLKLVRRGNLWKMYRGLPYRFRNPLREADFYIGLGRYTEVRNPETGSYLWYLDEAKEAIRRGTADCFAEPSSWSWAYGGEIWPLIKFLDPKIGKRIRAFQIKEMGRKKRKKRKVNKV